MPYDPEMVRPMKEEVTRLGVKQLTTAADVDKFFASKKGTAFLFINSVCGCAAGGARPALRIALANDHLPDRIGSVFAGQDAEATNRARAMFADYPPSSPSAALLKDGEVVFFLPRHEIEGRDPASIAHTLVQAFDEHCAMAKKA
ncbi:MAG: BrxA/BrxB family bacilliredoxin [Planctomycetaceae bacterium]